MEEGDLEHFMTLNDAIDGIDRRVRAVHFLDGTRRKAVLIEMGPVILCSKPLPIRTGVVVFTRFTRCVLENLPIMNDTELNSIPYGE